MPRRICKTVTVGGVPIGGTSPVTVQSMLSVRAADIPGNVAQAVALEAAGCEILRVAVPDMDAVKLIPAIKQTIKIPLVADIHFDYRLALESVAAGIDKIRLNPGNIGGPDKVKAVTAACRGRGIPIRIGVNAGSLEPEILQKYGAPTAEAMRDSALRHARLLEACDFTDIVLSLKSSHVPTMIRAYELTAEACDYPLHLGVTEAGPERIGVMKSAAGIGALLSRGIGDTVRISLTADPIVEVTAGLELLQIMGLRKTRPELISCPTCGRTGIDLIKITTEVEKRLQDIRKPITVAVMGCRVNGPGEARQADIGIAGGEGKAALFKKGEVLYSVDEDRAVDALMDEIGKM